MQKALLFFIAVFVIVVIAYGKSTHEGFTSMFGFELTSRNEGTPDNLNSKSTTIPTAPVAQLGVGNIEPSPAPPSDLPTAPTGFHSKETPSPYRLPTNEPAKYIRILGLKEDLQAFFAFESSPLNIKTDPSIQMPLTRARADLSELIDIQSVMERNPGLPSRMTTKQVNDIQSNLSYLRQVLRDLEASGAIQQTSSEGFANMNKNHINKTKQTKRTNERASLRDLQEFQIKLVVEMKRLGASGTSDPLVMARTNTLNSIKNDIDDVISKLENGLLTPMTVPIMKSDIEKSLPVLGQANKSLPRALKTFSLPPAIASLFPNGMSPKDAEQATQINNIASGYLKNLFENASWGINIGLKYDNPHKKPSVIPCCPKMGTSACVHKQLLKNQSRRQSRERKSSRHQSRERKSSRHQSRERKSSKHPVESKHLVTYGIPGVHQTQSQAPNNMNSCSPPQKTDTGTTPGLPGVSNRIYPDPKAGGLDWEKRSSEIVKQIKGRGLNPLQFGAIPDNTAVSHEFSWRGYTRMICSRLNSTTDPGLAVSCGCPPENWNGWKE